MGKLAAKTDGSTTVQKLQVTQWKTRLPSNCMTKYAALPHRHLAQIRLDWIWRQKFHWQFPAVLQLRPSNYERRQHS